MKTMHLCLMNSVCIMFLRRFSFVKSTIYATVTLSLNVLKSSLNVVFASSHWGRKGFEEVCGERASQTSRQFKNI